MFTKRTLLNILLVAFFAALFTGCVSSQKEALSIQTESKKFIYDKDRANLYIYRDEIFGAAIGMNVEVDNQLIGKTGAKTYFHLKLQPGEHTVVSYAENKSAVTLDLEKGKNYFVWQEVKMGMFRAGSKLQQVSEEVGEKAVLECELLKSQANFK